MPLTPFQKEVLGVLAGNRSEASHFAGGLVLNAPEDSARYSHDFDVFHEAVGDLVAASERDVAALESAGFHVEKIERQEEWSKPSSFRKARVRRSGSDVELDWAHDSAFRFFPIVPDDQLGWRLHLFDMATNKALALSARTETRDYVDMVELARRYPLEAIVWAACGKDPGFNPLSLLKMMIRFARIDPVKLEEIQARRLDPFALKEEWIAAADRAREEMTRLADEQIDMPIGVAFVDEQGAPGWIRTTPALKIHFPSLRGCWPTMHPASPE
ncbi:MAG: hypothetical protein D4R65_04580 [Verrucomicrobiaceae bacterium]|nr:MAG: hypothetical protein D4R65_04580 [Verrucomicrobiaceae bacterium]